MKNLLFILLYFLPLLAYTQTQIGDDIDGEATEDESGRSVSLSPDGNVVAIGAPYILGNGIAGSYVKVYHNDSGTWTQIGSDFVGQFSFGHGLSLSMDGTVLAIGTIFNNNENGNNAGHVQVYQNNAGSWTQIGSDIYGEAAEDYSGSSVSLSADGNTVAIGAYGNDGSFQDAGHVRVYQNNMGTWTQIGTDIDGEANGDGSGMCISLSADAMVVAIASRVNDGNGSGTGHVRVYQNNAGIWTQLGADIDGENDNDNSGWSLSLSADGSVVAIGAPHNSENGSGAGQVKVYQYIAGTWSQIGANINGESSGDLSGTCVSLSADGTVVAIGAHLNDGNLDETNNSGHVRMYQNIAGTWMQMGNDIDGETAGDLSGLSVSLSADGTVVAIGAMRNDGNGIDAGHVRVYDLSAILSSDHLVQSDFIVYPNPASDFLTIQLNESLQLESVNIYTPLGQLLRTERNKIISVNDLAKGIYLIEVVTDQGTAAKKIIVD